MILEGIVTTLDEDGSVRISPMGPSVEPDFGHLVFRPFQTSRTFLNLRRSGQGVFHVTDDVELIAQAAIDRLPSLPALAPAPLIDGLVLTDACRWYVFRVESIQDDTQRAVVACQVLQSGFQREFFGFNRAKHAVIEAAILATRVQIMEADRLWQELEQLAPLVAKTGGQSEQRAFNLLNDFIKQSVSRPLRQEPECQGGEGDALEPPA